MLVKHIGLSNVFFAAAVLVPGIAALAQGVGGTSPTETSHTLDPAVTAPPDLAHWVSRVGSVQNPLGVELDAAGPVWSTLFNTLGNELILPNQKVEITEYLLIQGDRPWTGWGTRILTDNFAWCPGGWPSGPGIRVRGSDGASVPGLAVDYSETLATASFATLLPTTQIQVSARLCYTGTEPFSGPLQLEQFPIPEPTTFLAFLICGALIRRRQKRCQEGYSGAESGADAAACVKRSLEPGTTTYSGMPGIDAAAGPMDVPLGAVFAAQASLGAATSGRMTTGVFRVATLTINVAAVPGTHHLSAFYGSYTPAGATDSATMVPGPVFEIQVGE